MEQYPEQSSSISLKTRFGWFKTKIAKFKTMTKREWADFVLNNLIYLLFIPFIIFIMIYSQNFFSLTSIMNNIKNISQYMFAALGVGTILILVGADLSAGRIIGITAILAAALLQAVTYPWKTFPNMSPWPVIVVLLIVLVIGGLIGAFNGFFVAKFKLNPFIVTFATQVVLYAFIRIFFDLNPKGPIAGSTTTIGGPSSSYINWVEGNIALGGGNFLYLYIFYAVIAIFVTWFMWNKTTFGKNMYAVGSNPEAANISGINVTKTIIFVFIFAGILYGFSGWIQGAIDVGPSIELGNEAGRNFVLDAIAACIIGGVSLTGGVGKVRNIVLGVVMLQLISYSLVILGISKNYQDVVKGALILFAVAVDMRRYLTKK